MLDIVREAEAAWQAGDSDALIALFAPSGASQALGTVDRVNDGSFEEFVESGMWTSLDVHEPMLVTS